VSIRGSQTLRPWETAEVLALIAAATAADGRASVSAETQLDIRHGSRSLDHVLSYASGRLAGYGALTTAAGPRAMLAEIAVLPDARHRGHGEAILGELLRMAAPQRLSIWAHGADSAIAGFAEAHGLHRDRTLHQMRRPLDGVPPRQPLPTPYRVRTFAPGTDDEALLAANAAAFAQLPDQGGWTSTDLQARVTQDWFDPAGLFLAVAPDGLIAGFHWTKLHAPEPLGEIYVLGVRPAHRRHGLARALALWGLAHLADRGATTAMLYVDAGNAPALHLYTQLGFTRTDTDTLYRA
jgi:mycothiol synthase